MENSADQDQRVMSILAAALKRRKAPQKAQHPPNSCNPCENPAVTPTWRTFKPIDRQDRGNRLESEDPVRE
jgi:hypothetical protein